METQSHLTRASGCARVARDVGRLQAPPATTEMISAEWFAPPLAKVRCKSY